MKSAIPVLLLVTGFFALWGCNFVLEPPTNEDAPPPVKRTLSECLLGTYEVMDAAWIPIVRRPWELYSGPHFLACPDSSNRFELRSDSTFRLSLNVAILDTPDFQYVRFRSSVEWTGTFRVSENVEYVAHSKGGTWEGALEISVDGQEPFLAHITVEDAEHRGAHGNRIRFAVPLSEGGQVETTRWYRKVWTIWDHYGFQCFYFR